MGVLLVFDLTNLNSFQSCEKWLETLREHVDWQSDDAHAAVTLVGTKADLQKQRQVSPILARSLVQKYGLSYVETSSSTDTSIRQAFKTTTERFLKRAKQSGFLAERRLRSTIRLTQFSSPSLVMTESSSSKSKFAASKGLISQSRRPSQSARLRSSKCCQ